MMTQLNLLSVLFNCAKQAHTQILEQAEKQGDQDLCGWCAKGTASLFNLLVEEGLAPIIKVWQCGEMGHCYIQCNGYLLDVTAGQFGLNPIEIVKLRNLKLPKFWRARKTLLSPVDLVAYLRKHRWHPDSIPAL